MPIPELNTNGFLPVGVHDCTLTEVLASFGSFQNSDQRPRLFSRLEDLARAMQSSGLFEGLVIPMSEYTLVSRTLLRRRFGFDVIIAEQDSQLYKTYIEFFSLVRDDPAARKGLLRVRL
jgi:hypothetical protein